MRNWFVAALMSALAGTAGLAQPAPSQPPQAPPEAEQAPIVVQGRDRDTQIRALIDALPKVRSNGHIARFEEATCPAVLGLSPAQADYTVQRMRIVAKAAGVPVGKPKCLPNLLVLVTADKKRLIDYFTRHNQDYLGDLGNRDAMRLARDPSPTALWYLTGTVDADGRAGNYPGADFAVQRTTRPGSRLTDSGHRAFMGSVLVVESHALIGLSTTQFADYALVRSLTGADPARLPERDASTVLNALDAPMGSEVPLTLTKWDLAFLQSIYASDPNRYAPLQRSEITNAMNRRLDKQGKAEQHN